MLLIRPASAFAVISILVAYALIDTPAFSQGFDFNRVINGLNGIARGAMQYDLQRRQMEIERQREDNQVAPGNLRQEPLSAPGAPVLYQSDGLTLSGLLNKAAVADRLECSDSPSRPGMTFCKGGSNKSLLSVFVDRVGRVSYFSRYFEGLRITRSGVDRRIRNLGKLFGTPHIADESTGPDGSYSILASWGNLSLSPEAAQPDTPGKPGIYVHYPRPATNPTPVYHVSGGPGFYFLASYNSRGNGTLRYGALDERLFSDIPTTPAGNPDMVGGDQLPPNIYAGQEPIPQRPFDRFVRFDPRFPSRAGSAVGTRASEQGPLSGEWIGTSTCDGKQQDLALETHRSPSSDITATIAFFHDNELATPVAHFDMLAREDDTSGTYRFVPRQPSDKLTFTATLSNNGRALKVSSDTCGVFTLNRTDLLGGSISLATTRASYRPSDPLPQRCKAIASWATRLTREYPDLDLHHTSMDKLYPKAVLLFSDEDFVPLAGFTYDLGATNVIRKEDASQERVTLGQIGHNLSNDCGSDPFIRQDGADFWASPLFQSAFPSTVISPFVIYFGGSFSIPAIRHFVQDARSADYEVKTKLTAARHGEVSDIAQMLAIKSNIESHRMYLWPSELKTAEDDIGNSIGTLAAAEGERGVNQLRKEADPVKGLAKARELLSDAPTGAFGNMRPADHERFAGQVGSLRHNFAVSLFKPFQSQADGVGNDLKGAVDLQSILARSNEMTNLFSDDDKTAMQKGISSKLDSMLGSFVSSDVNALKSYPESVEGLRKGCEWIDTFSGKYANFMRYDAVTAGTRAFQENRAQRLIAAVPEATAALAQVGSDVELRKAVLHNYLCWSGDRTLPESLEYDLLLAGS